MHRAFGCFESRKDLVNAAIFTELLIHYTDQNCERLP